MYTVSDLHLILQGLYSFDFLHEIFKFSMILR